MINSSNSEEVCIINSCHCHEELLKIMDLQEKMVKDKFDDLFDSVIASRLLAMKDMGITQYDSDEFYSEARQFFEQCFQDSVKNYFK